MSINYYLHIECEFHFLIKISDENCGEVLNKWTLTDVLLFLLYFKGLLWVRRRNRWARLPSVLKMVLRKHYVKSIIYDTWQLSVFYKCYLIYIVWLIASHQKILVEISQIRRELILDKIAIDGSIVVFDHDQFIILQIRFWYR